jgi:ParB family chromosome partitioning protein
MLRTDLQPHKGRDVDMAKASSVAGGGTVRVVLPIAAIIPDDDNRKVLEDDEFVALGESIRLFGVLQPIQVWRRPDGTHRLIDGERRWRAAQSAGLVEVPCDVWPGEADPRRVAMAGLVLNEHRRAHGCLQVARRLRDIKNENGLTLADVAAQTGFPLDRVKTYFSLFGASDDVAKFLEEREVPLKIAAELVRYQRATNEARARRLLERYKETPLTVQEIIALRKREDRPARDEQPTRAARPKRFVEQFEAEARRDPSMLEDLARKLGYRLVPLAPQAQA